MATRFAPPADRWETIEYRRREYFRFELVGREGRRIPFTIARRIADRYAVREVLTRGGGGVILVADDVRTQNTVLIKAIADYATLRYDLSHPVEDVVESIRRSRHHLQTERRILVWLRNAGSAAVPHPHDYVFDANPVLKGPHRTASGHEWRFNDLPIITSEPYLVMQRVPGLTLKELLRDHYRRGLDEPTALAVVDQVARVVERLHRPRELANGQTWQIVYQDLKPGNILVDRYGRATVLDFGGSQIIVDGTLVLQGSYSPGYCAPESGRWGEAVTPAADCYCLGTTLFHMLSGTHPRRLLPRKLPEGAPRAAHIDPAPLARRCSKPVVAILAKALSWDPAQRFQDASEFRAAISPLLEAAGTRYPDGKVLQTANCKLQNAN